MTEHPIVMSAPMVRAILSGAKTQTRRTVKPTPPPGAVSFGTYYHPDPRPHFWAFDGDALMDFAVPCPYGAPGDQLWVREAFGAWLAGPYLPEHWLYRADGNEGWAGRWKASIHMPRAASRIQLEVVSVRVERLQDISEADARGEGAPPSHPSIDRISREFGYADFSRSWYAQLWEQINGPGSWGANPWVWVVVFKRLVP